MKNIKIFVSLIILPLSLLAYKITGRMLPRAYLSLVIIFSVTGGRINDWISEIISIFSKRIKFENKKGVLGDLSDCEKLNKIVNEIKENGYVVFPGILSEEILNKLVNFTLKNEAKIRRSDNQDGDFYLSNSIYSGGKPNAVRYDYSADDLLRQKEVQDLISDASLLAVAQNYLGATPIVDILSMWWHTNFSDKPDSTAAQYFHFDLDRIKWLKIFIYITDVESGNGPHYFIEGTHKTNAIPSKLLNKGYVRLLDTEVIEIYDGKKIIEFTGKKGTVIIEDTRGLHKGSHVINESRLILQLQFSNSLFGADDEKYKFSKISSKSLSDLIEKYPQIYKKFL
jgi:hypothetical protein